MKEREKLHLGCANVAPSGWVNLDGSWNAWLAQHPLLRRVSGGLGMIPGDQLRIHWPKNILVHDVRKRLPFPEGAFSAVYASHLLEHLYLEEALRLLPECLRVLEPGGILRLVVPDLRSMVLDYLEGEKTGDQGGDKKNWSSADRLCQRLDMRPPVVQRANIFYRFYCAVKDFHTHKWMYDAESLKKHMAEAGFVDISPKSFLESAIPGIEEVERKERFDGSAGVCLEGKKPFA